jgi:hypothetical protein
MMWLDPATVIPTPTDSRSQRRIRSFKTSDRAAARMQPKSSAGDAVDGSPSRASSACVNATEV